MNSAYLLFKVYIIQFTLLFLGISSQFCFSQTAEQHHYTIKKSTSAENNKFKSLFEVNNILSDDPDNSYALFIRGKIKVEMGAYKSAQTDFSHALLIGGNQNKINIYFNRGISFYQENDFLNAIADFDSALFLNPSHLDAMWKKAQSFYFLGANEETINTLDNLTHLNPDNPITWHDLGTLYYKTKKLSKAKDCFTKSLILNPQMAVSYNHRGIIYENLQQYSLAFDDFTRALQYDSTYVDAYNNRGLIYMLFEDFSQAESDFSFAILHSNDTAKEALNNRALSRCILGYYDDSLLDINQLITHYPFYSKAYITRGNIKEYMHDDSGACADWQKAAELGDLIGIQYTQKACQ